MKQWAIKMMAHYFFRKGKTMKDNIRIEYDEHDDRNIKYIINEEKKVVVCLIEAEIESPILGELILQTRGIARCLPEDKFDAEKGKIIARDKADIKYHKAKIFDYHQVLNVLKEQMNVYHKLVDKHQNKIDNVTYHLEKYTK